MATIIRFLGKYCEIAMGHKEIEGFSPSAPYVKQCKAIKPIARDWFESEDPTWFEIDDEYHNLCPCLTRSGSMGIYDSEGSDLIYPLFESFSEALKIKEFAYKLEQKLAPHRKGDNAVGVMAWEVRKGLIEYSIPHDSIDPGKLTFIITRFAGLCDLTEDDNIIYMITDVFYDNKKIEQSNVSGSGKLSQISFGFIDSYNDDEKPEEDMEDRLTEIDFGEIPN